MGSEVKGYIMETILCVYSAHWTMVVVTFPFMYECHVVRNYHHKNILYTWSNNESKCLYSSYKGHCSSSLFSSGGLSHIRPSHTAYPYNTQRKTVNPVLTTTCIQCTTCIEQPLPEVPNDSHIIQVSLIKRPPVLKRPLLGPTRGVLIQVPLLKGHLY